MKQTKPDVTVPALDGRTPLYQPGAAVPQSVVLIGQLAKRVPPDPVKRTHSGVLVNVSLSQAIVPV